MPRAPKPYSPPAPKSQRLVPSAPEPERWLSLKDAADLCGVSTHTIRRALARRELRYFKDGRCSANATVRIPVPALEAWRQSHWVEMPAVG